VEDEEENCDVEKDEQEVLATKAEDEEGKRGKDN